MIELTDSQIEILKAFLEYDQETKGKVGNGLSSAALGKRGLNRRTFEINLPFLLSHYLLKISKQEKHGFQNWKYYDLTPLGIIALLKHSQKLKSGKDFILSERFFPHIKKYQKKLETIFSEFEFEMFLSRTSDQIEVSPLHITKEKRGGLELGRTSWHNERMSFLLMDAKFKGYPLEVSIFNNYSLTDFEMDFLTKKGAITLVKEKHLGLGDLDKKISEGITDRFTFLFFLNCINYPYIGVFDKPTVTFLDEDRSRNKDLKKIENEAKKHAEETFTKMKKNPKKIISIINNDPKLKKLFMDTIERIKKDLNQLKKIDEIYNSLIH